MLLAMNVVTLDSAFFGWKFMFHSLVIISVPGDSGPVVYSRWLQFTSPIAAVGLNPIWGNYSACGRWFYPAAWNASQMDTPCLPPIIIAGESPCDLSGLYNIKHQKQTFYNGVCAMSHLTPMNVSDSGQTVYHSLCESTCIYLEVNQSITTLISSTQT